MRGRTRIATDRDIASFRATRFVVPRGVGLAGRGTEVRTTETWTILSWRIDDIVYLLINKGLR